MTIEGGPMKINAQPRTTNLSGVLILVPILIASLAVGPCLAQARLYTNADLKALGSNDQSDQGKRKAVTNADLKAPLPTQAAPVAPSASWDAVLAFIEREHAYEQKQREMDLAYAKMAMESAQIERFSCDRYA